jgi:type I site-specific restriction endonuclease
VEFARPAAGCFELHTGSGRADYLLKDKLGRVLCVLEAKRVDVDPYEAKEQARGYAENLKAPFVILSNGREHWFWNYARKDERDAYRIERLEGREYEVVRFRGRDDQQYAITLGKIVSSKRWRR